jgi:excisionase family DNA binding protein
MSLAAEKAGPIVAHDDGAALGSSAAQCLAPTGLTSQPHGQPPELLAVADLAAVFGRSERTIRRWISQGSIPALRVGRSIFFRSYDVSILIVRGIEATALKRARACQSPRSNAQLAVRLGDAAKALNQ